LSVHDFWQKINQNVACVLQLHTFTGHNRINALHRGTSVDSGSTVMMWLLLIPLLGLTAFTLWNAPRFPRLNAYSPDRSLTNEPNASETRLVSVLIPSRNEEANLSALLPTLMAQTYTNIEVVVLDDHSHDAFSGRARWSADARMVRQTQRLPAIDRSFSRRSIGVHRCRHALESERHRHSGQCL
jgi:cellulose synthase/poly-beta-1,6-N-acetylglucosamine synthase-like glycosyltransferase